MCFTNTKMKYLLVHVWHRKEKDAQYILTNADSFAHSELYVLELMRYVKITYGLPCKIQFTYTTKHTRHDSY